MTWQDTVITITVIGLSYALIPQIIKAYKEKKSLISIQTGAVTSIGMIIIGTTYLTLNLNFASTMNFIAGILWITLLIQSIIYKK